MSAFQIISGGLLSAALLFTGCEDNSADRSAVSIKKEQKAVVQKEVAKQELSKNQETFEKIDLSDTFKDNAKIAANEKYQIMIFQRAECKYCNKLQKDIVSDKVFKDRLRDEFSTYSIDTGTNKMHKIMHEGKFMDVDTKTLIDIYGITSTPTIIFSDKSSKSIFLVPGYMPKEQFLSTLDFVNSAAWLDKDRKNGQVYEELKAFYMSKGIIKDDKAVK